MSAESIPGEGTFDQSNAPLMQGFGAGGYRSLRDLQSFGALRKVTLIAGQNNTGKSNILRFAASFLKAEVDGLTWVDQPQPDGPQLQIQLAHRPFTDRGTQMSAEHQELLRGLLRRPIFHPVDGDDVWVTYSPDQSTSPMQGKRRWVVDPTFLDNAMDQLDPDHHLLGRASSELTSTAGGGRVDDLRRILDSLFPFDPPPVRTVGAFRQISMDAADVALEAPGVKVDVSSDDHHSGRNLVRRLAKLESPPAESWATDRPRFEAINQFARTVLEDRDVTIRIPAAQDQILIEQAGRVLPLSSLGTGIHQVIILATAATLLERTLVCIEEPEVHLHPLLQRKLIRYLSEATNNQYLIATHSAHMLDYERATVLHVQHDQTRGTVVTQARTLQAVSNLCADLGYRPSDLIQANAVVWVEGPSDRIYLRHWLEVVAPREFVEGIHYSIMFYGGGLLNHLTADDPAVEEFISLRRLNRHSAILIDSDKASGKSNINATKVRIRTEFDRADMPGFAWVTACRTIENYVPNELLAEVVGEVHSQSIYSPPTSKWDDPLRVLTGNRARAKESKSADANASVRPDKVKIARRAVLMWGDDLPFDLRQRMAQVVTFIRIANGSDSPLPGQPLL